MNKNNLPEMRNPLPPPPLTTEAIRWQKYYEIEAVKTAYERDKQQAHSNVTAFVSGIIAGVGLCILVLVLIAN
jgi:F0F1-type ATP synthase assembly protein I